MSRIVIITASPRDPASGAIVTERLAGGGQFTPYYFRDLHWRAGIADLPKFRSALGFDDTGWTGAGSVPSTTTIGFAPSTPAALEELAQLYWRYAPVVIEAAEESGGTLSWTTLLTGTIAGVEQADGKLVMTLTELGGPLDSPVISARFAGTGGVEGGAEAAGRLKRRTWGRAFNIEGRVLEKAYNIYEFGDLAFPWHAFDQLRDIGRAGSLSILSWQGSIAATLAALRGAVAPLGGGVAAPSIASAKWWTQPSGPLTADVRGEIGAGYVETVPEIAARVIAAAGAGTVANVAASAAIRAGIAGYHIDSASETVAGALDRLLLPVSLSWTLDPDGPIRFLPFTLDAPIETIRSLSVSRKRTFPPVVSRRIGYQRAWRTHDDGEISSLLYAQDVAFADGTTLAAVQPAEAGANVTETRIAAGANALGGSAAATILGNIAALQLITGSTGSIAVSIGAISDSLDETRLDLADARLTLETATADITSIETRVTLRPNLQPNGGFARLTAGMSGLPAGSAVPLDPQFGRYFAHSANGTSGPTMPSFPIQPGYVYTISWDAAFIATSGQIRMDVLQWSGADGTGTVVLSDASPALAPGFNFTDGTRRSLTFTALSGRASVTLRLASIDVVGAVAIAWRRIKAERGAAASLWTDEGSLNAVDAAVRQVDIARADDFAANAQRFIDVEARVTATEDAADGAAAAYSELVDAIATETAAQGLVNTRLFAQVGIRQNLIRNSGLERGTEGMLGTTGFAVDRSDAWGPRLMSYSVTGTGEVYWPSFDVVAGSWYTISADTCLIATGGGVYVDLLFYSSAGALLLTGPHNLRGATFDFSTEPAARDAIAVEVLAPGGATRAVPRFCYTGVTGITAIGVREIKAERGRLPWTAYTPSEKTGAQTLADITLLGQTLAGTNDALASLELTLTAAVGDAQDAADLAGGDASAALAQISTLAEVVADNDEAAGQRIDTLTAYVRSSPNQLRNSDAREGLANWTTSGGPWLTNVAPTLGSYFVILSGPGGSAIYQEVAVTAGAAWSASAEGDGLILFVQWYNAGGAQIGGNVGATAMTGGGRVASGLLTAPTGAVKARFVVYAASTVTGAPYFTRAQLQAGAATVWNDDASIRELRASVTTQAGVLASLDGRTQAYFQITSAVPGARAQMTIYAFASDGSSAAGVDIIGDVSISGNLLVAGTVVSGKLEYGATGRASFYYHLLAIQPTITSWYSILGTGLTPDYGAPTDGFFSFGMRAVSGAATVVYVRVIRTSDGNTVWGDDEGTPCACPLGAGFIYVASKFTDTVPAGQRAQYDVQVKAATSNVEFHVRVETLREQVRERWEEIQIYAPAGVGPGAGDDGGGSINGDMAGPGDTGGTVGTGTSGYSGGGLRWKQVELP